MTTNASPQKPPTGGLAVLVGAASWGLGTAVLGVIAGFVIGTEAGVGALVGGLAAIAVLATGTWVVLRVAAAAPVAGLLAALVVYTAQGLLLLLTLAILARVTDGDQTEAAAFAVIAVTVVWTSMFAVYVRRERIPIFDLSALAPDSPAQPPQHGPGPEER
ncbi:MAG: hypothetical protein J7518_00355 [Nocardioidaceae bacterium]|nr:hypothetical protein [Nocardioidaceae bacterium]